MIGAQQWFIPSHNFEISLSLTSSEASPVQCPRISSVFAKDMHKDFIERQA